MRPPVFNPKTVPRSYTRLNSTERPRRISCHSFSCCVNSSFLCFSITSIRLKVSVGVKVHRVHPRRQPTCKERYTALPVPSPRIGPRPALWRLKEPPVASKHTPPTDSSPPPPRPFHRSTTRDNPRPRYCRGPSSPLGNLPSPSISSMALVMAFVHITTRFFEFGTHGVVALGTVPLTHQCGGGVIQGLMSVPFQKGGLRLGI